MLLQLEGFPSFSWLNNILLCHGAVFAVSPVGGADPAHATGRRRPFAANGVEHKTGVDPRHAVRAFAVFLVLRAVRGARGGRVAAPCRRPALRERKSRRRRRTGGRDLPRMAFAPAAAGG